MFTMSQALAKCKIREKSTIHLPIMSLPRRCECIQAHGGHMKSVISLWIQFFFTLISSVILNLVFSALMNLVSTDHSVIWFSMNTTMCINKYYQLKYFIYQDRKWDLSVPLIFLIKFVSLKSLPLTFTQVKEQFFNSFV